MRKLLTTLIFILLAGIAHAEVTPAEVMDDPVLHRRAMALYEDLRCVKCQSETIASSNADWANDARSMVRELLLDGNSDQDVLDFFHGRYGDYVLMRTQFKGAGVLLWVAGPLLLLLGAGVAFGFLRGRSSSLSPEGLTAAESERLKQLLDEQG